jgi:hypothetical protein
MRRPDAAIVLLAVGGVFILYYTSFATDLGAGCPPAATVGCAIYWGLDALSWAAGLTCLAFVALLASRPRWHRIAGATACALSGAFLTGFGLFLRDSSTVTLGLILVLLIFLWPYFVAILGGVVALLWRPRDQPSASLTPPRSWPGPPDWVSPPP